MSPKRSYGPSPSQTPGKRRRTAKEKSTPKEHGTQNTIEFFFKQASKPSGEDDTGLNSYIDLSSNVPAQVASTSCQRPVTIEEDVGIRIPQRIKEIDTRAKSSFRTHEIIDVDSLEAVTSFSLSDGDEPIVNDHLAAAQRSDEEARVSPRTALQSPKPKNVPTEIPADRISAEAFPDLSVPPLEFCAIECPWQEVSTNSSPTPYSFLAHALCSLSATRSRILITNIQTNALRLIICHDPQSLVPALYLLSNCLSPPYVPSELGLGSSIITKAIQHVSGLSHAALRQLYNKTGDAGDVAFEARSKLRTLIPHSALTVHGVFTSLLKIAQTKGEGAMKQRQAIVERLLVASQGEEARYLVRTLSFNIRVGAAKASILTSLSHALVLTRSKTEKALLRDSPYFATPEDLLNAKASGTKKGKKDDSAGSEIIDKFSNAESLLKRIYAQHPNYDHIVRGVFEVGLEGLAEQVTLTVGVPLLPTLGSPTRSLEEIYDRLGNLPFMAEFKYDGQRAQIHATKVENGRFVVRIFSRNLEDMTDKYPDVVSTVEEMFTMTNELKSFIMDAEIVAINCSDGSLKSFQELSNRVRRDVKLHEITVDVCIFAFDLMLYNDISLLECPFRFRREQLVSHFPPLKLERQTAAWFSHVESRESLDGRDAIEGFWQKAINSRCEGLMIKLLDSGEVLEESSTKGTSRRKPLPATYEPDKRTSAWLKLKKDYVQEIGDSLDLVPIGAWHGNGRKAAWWSPVLLAVWDEQVGKFVGVCKCMSGFTDEFYKVMKEHYAEGSENCSRTPLWDVNTGGLTPTVYFRPQEVWEIRGADITLSPISVAALGLVSSERGLSLRFPRFMRVREDKLPTDASTPEFLASLWRRQDNVGRDTKGNDDGDLVDVSPETSEVEQDDEL